MDSNLSEGAPLAFPSALVGFNPPADLYEDVLARPQQSVPVGATKLMLVVSDEAHARVLASDLESRFCATVVSGADFPTAWWRFSSSPDAPDVLLVEPELDLTPTGAALFQAIAPELSSTSPTDLDGWMLADMVRRRRPDIGVVVLVTDEFAATISERWTSTVTHADPHDPDAVALAAASVSAAAGLEAGVRRLHRVA